MKWFYNLKIGVKLIIGFAIVALIAAIVGYQGIINISKIEKADTELYENYTVPISMIGEVSTLMQRLRVNTRDIVIANEPKDIETYENRITEYREKIGQILTNYEKLISSEEEKQLYNDYKQIRQAYLEDLTKHIGLAKANKDAEAVSFIQGEFKKTADAYMNIIDKLVEVKVKGASLISDSNTALAKKATNIMIVFVVFGILIAVGLGIFISRIISKPINKMVTAAEKLAVGDINVTVEANTKDEVGQLANAFERMIENVKGQANAADKISQGDLSVSLAAKSENDVLSKSMLTVIETLKNLIAESKMLTKAAGDGKLDVRGNADKFNGGYKEIVEGVNRTLDAVIGPLNVAAEYVDRISKGDVPSKITDAYYGDFNEIKNNINGCIDAVNALITDANVLAKAAVDGKLSTRADSSKHQGDFRRIVEGVNNTLDAVIEPVKEASGVLQEMAKGNLQIMVKGNYKGDHAEIKDALNLTIDSVRGYVNEISAVLTEMANGNLVVGINNDYRGDFSQIKDSLNLIIKSFNEVLGEIDSAAEQVNSGARHVSSSSQALSQGSTEQASSVEEITASMTEIGSQTKQNAVNANQANEMAVSVKEIAVQGNDQMKEMLNAMQEINEASTNISKIIKVIDEIAFQTNILALNAAVEAARAGQHGKGFAVVAEEVRNLAARSANAAKETTTMIEGSMRKVESGTDIANQTAKALNEIVEGVSKVTTIVGNIAVASNEQATGIAQVNQGIAQVSKVTQINTATAEESASASEQLSGQAVVLKDMVKRFKLKKVSRKNNSHYQEQSEDIAQIESTGNYDGKEARKEAAVTHKLKIDLDDKEFGKY